jgi:dCTP deaminase
MGLLTDTELRNRIRTAPQLIEDFDTSRIEQDVYGCAAYLHIGDIFLPGSEANQIGSAGDPLKINHCLTQGQTAVLRTKEKFKLDGEHAAVVFPSSSVSMQGLLMTNPGHVDPGYAGHLHVTVINMGSKPFPLVPNARFLRALVFKLDSAVASPLNATASPITKELLARLSPDFLDVTGRAKVAAKNEIDRAVRANVWAQYGLPALAAVVAALITGLVTYYTQARNVEDQIQALKDVNAARRLDDLENRIPTAQRLQTLESEVERLKGAAAPK